MKIGKRHKKYAGFKRRPGGGQFARNGLAGLCASASRQAQHPVHHGRRHRHHAAEHLSSRPDGRGNAEHRPHRKRRRALHDILCRAELHRRAQCLLHRHASASHGHDSAATARQPVLAAAWHSRRREVPARSRLQHRRVRQESPRRPRRGAADRAWLPGVLGLPVPPRRDAGRELPRHQQEPDRARHCAAVQNTPIPGLTRGPRRRGPANDDVPDAAAAGARVQVVGRIADRTRPARTRGR